MNSVLASRPTAIFYLFLVLGSAFGYQPQQQQNAQLNRRSFLSFVTASATASVLMTEEPANAIISSKYCAFGSGEDCDDLAEGNEFIRQLQARSAANKEKNESVGEQRALPCLSYCELHLQVVAVQRVAILPNCVLKSSSVCFFSHRFSNASNQLFSTL